MPALNSKPFHSTYVETAYRTFDTDSPIGCKSKAWWSPWCLLTRVGYEPAPVVPSPFHLPSTSHIQYTYATKQLHSHPSLTCFQYTNADTHHPYNVICPSGAWIETDHANAIDLDCAEPEPIHIKCDCKYIFKSTIGKRIVAEQGENLDRDFLAAQSCVEKQ